MLCFPSQVPAKDVSAKEERTLSLSTCQWGAFFSFTHDLKEVSRGGSVRVYRWKFVLDLEASRKLSHVAQIVVTCIL